MNALSSHQDHTPRQSFFRWIRSVFYYEHWMVGVIDQPISQSLTWSKAPPIRWIEPFAKNRYFADPFPWPGSSDTILCEEFDNAKRLGRITVLKLGDQGIADEVKTYFPLPCHLSFPFVFMHAGRVFAMPESCASKRLEIFEWKEKEAVWVPFSLIFEDKGVADAALYVKDDYFWISYTDVTDHPHDNLNLLYASDLKGPWIAHPANPVRKGLKVSRNGGSVFSVNGKLYRPAQDCSDIYGGSLRVMEILNWTTSTYEEKEITHITPSSSDYPHGFHTLSEWGNRCLVDGMRLTFSLSLVWSKVKKRLGF